MEIKYKRIGKNRYALERTSDMKADAIFYANDKLLPLVTRDDSLKQLQETAQLPHLMSPILGMPDMHQGYGIPVGGVMVSEKIVSAGCVGMDINCGVRLLRCGVSYDEKLFSKKYLEMFIRKIEKVIPMGLGGKHRNSASLSVGKAGSNLEEVIARGARYVVEEGFGTPDDLKFCEESGAIDGADISKLSKKSLSRARRQVGTLGSGNHFVELQKIEKVYDKKTADIYGLKENLVCFMIHSGSRALGHQTCIDYTNKFIKENEGVNSELVPVRNLASALVDSQVGKDYLAAMNGAINFAFANRQMMAHQFRKVFIKFMESLGVEVSVELIYDVAHNSAKWEVHKGKKVLVHRKGATRALPPNHTDNPKAYINTGHPAFVPGSMGTASYVLVGTEKANETYFSVNHGAGRAMSRTEAKRTIKKEDFERQMEGIVFNKPYRIVADEAPAAYKNVEDVIDSLEEIGITKKVAKLVPLAVMKGD